MITVKTVFSPPMGAALLGILPPITMYNLKRRTPTRFKKDDIIEIQVVSVLQNAWAEVEHNIVYEAISALLM